MSRTKPLYDLQQVDLHRDEVQRKHRLVLAALESSSIVAAARRQVEVEEQALRDIDHELRKVDGERQSLKGRITDEERKLYGGTVKAPKELAGFQREVSSLKRQLATLDDRALERMLARDDAASRLDTSKQALSAAEDKSKANRKALVRQRDSLAQTEEHLREQRDRLAEAIPASDRAVYDRLRRAKGGRAVAAVASDVCGECGMMPPRHVRDEAAAGDALVFCPGCGRILHG
jgi:predicted  nucleic acid-binding Zn-ribbon protein